MVIRVAQANAKMSREAFTQFRDSLLAAIPEDNKSRQYVTEALDTLSVCYDQVRIRWSQLREARDLLTSGLKNDGLDDNEVERIRIALERSRMRFIAEELVIPYSILFDGMPTAIASEGKTLVVGTPNGLFSYNGRHWRTFTEADGLPSNEILSLYSGSSVFYVGTGKGLVMFTGRGLAPMTGGEQLSEGPVTAVGADGITRLWIVLDGELYRFDGTNWSNSRGVHGGDRGYPGKAGGAVHYIRDAR